MPQLRIALAQVDPTVGDLPGNAALVLEQAQRALTEGAHLVAFPEGMLPGYPAEDLVLRHSFVAATLATLDRLAADLAAAGCGELAVVVGYLDRCPDAQPQTGRPAGEPQNAAAVLWRGEVVARYAKHHLPNYGVFDEFRYFVRGDVFPVVRLHGVDIGLTICEDLWQEGGPIRVAREVGVDLVVCINGSPYEQGKTLTREDLAARRAREADAALLYVNLVGGQDELVFDGASFVVDAGGRVLARAAQYEETLLVLDLELPARGERHPVESVDAGDGTQMTVQRHTLAPEQLPPYEPMPCPPLAEPLDELAEMYGAVTLGTRDYVRKNGFRSVVLGLSGGIDSALVATIAVDALGSSAVHTVAMPSAYSSSHSLDDAAELARRQRTQHVVIPIVPMVEAYHDATKPVGGLHGLADENLQARVRGTLLMGLSNQSGHLVLTTGNKSELATGFSTLYGDSAGGFAPIKDVAKTDVWRLAAWRNKHAAAAGAVPPIPENSITKPPSAELAPGQLDADRLPPYDVLDQLLDAYVERDTGRDQLIASGYRPELVDRVIRLVDAAEYKRRQYPPGPKITPKAFGRDRRLPITSRWRELVAPRAEEPELIRPEQES